MTRRVAVRVARVVPGPPDVVWDLLTDWEHQGDWMLEARDFVVVSPHREGVGVEAEATVTIGGITTRDRIRVIAWEPGKRLAIAHLGWVSGTGDIRLTPVRGVSTLVDWTEELEAPLGPLGALGVRLFVPLMARIFARDLRVLEGLARAKVGGA